MIGDWLPPSLRRTHHFFNRGTTDLHMLCNWNIWTLLMAWRWRCITSPNPDQYHPPCPTGCPHCPPGQVPGLAGTERSKRTQDSRIGGKGWWERGCYCAQLLTANRGHHRRDEEKSGRRREGISPRPFKRTTGRSVDQTLEGVVLILWQLQSFYKFI